MKKQYLFIFFTVLTFSSISAQMLAKVYLDKPIEGACNQNSVYRLLTFDKNQVNAIPPISENEIIKKLNKDITYVIENADLNTESKIALVINCQGEVVHTEMKKSTKIDALDTALQSFFKNLGHWKSGTFSGKPVDSQIIYTIAIAEGRLMLK